MRERTPPWALLLLGRGVLEVPPVLTNADPALAVRPGIHAHALAHQKFGRVDVFDDRFRVSREGVAGCLCPLLHGIRW